MSGDDVIDNIAKLLMKFNFEIKSLSDELKCLECKSILKDSFQVSCGCRFCRSCVKDMKARGEQFCPGNSEGCDVTPLTNEQRDYRANKSISKLIAECPRAGCSYECPLADMENHLRMCQGNFLDGPVREFECPHCRLTADEIKEKEMLKNEQMRHLENEIKSIKDEIEIIKYKSIENENKLTKDENKLIKDENKLIKDENKLIKDENKLIKNEIKSIKDENKSIKDNIELIKDENKLIKDENKLIKDENKLIKNEIKSIKDENKLIKEEIQTIKMQNKSIKQLIGFSKPVQLFLEKLDREIKETPQSDDVNNTRISAVRRATASNRDALDTELEPIRHDIRSIWDQFDSMTYQVESIQVAVGMGQLADWLIGEDVGKTEWWSWDTAKTSGKFRGGGRPHTYELASRNSVSGAELVIYLRIWAGQGDAMLEWPFRGAVTVTVAHQDRREVCSRQTRRCRIERPPENRYRFSDAFRFPHAVLRGTGLDLERGVRVSCQIVPCL